MGSSTSRSSNIISEKQTNHLVSLTSTTYGSLLLTDHTTKPSFNRQDFAKVKKLQDFINSEDPLSPHSVINTWELMEGLDEDAFDFQIVDYPKKPSKKELDSSEIVKSFEFVDHPASKTLWEHLSDESNVVSNYQQALIKSKDVVKSQKIETFVSSDVCCLVSSDESCDLKCVENRIVLYYTSLRGIRKTYEDCCAVRIIFRGFRVCVDEKDISMDRSYRMELQEALKGNGISLPAISLPQVFIKGKYIGGAEEIKQLNDGGELAKLLEGCPVMDLMVVCESCGDARFVPCPNCNGSRKVYEEGEGDSRMCGDCNENGLIRCSNCCP